MTCSLSSSLYEIDLVKMFLLKNFLGQWALEIHTPESLDHVSLKHFQFHPVLPVLSRCLNPQHLCSVWENKGNFQVTMMSCGQHMDDTFSVTTMQGPSSHTMKLQLKLETGTKGVQEVHCKTTYNMPIHHPVFVIHTKCIILWFLVTTSQRTVIPDWKID